MNTQQVFLIEAQKQLVCQMTYNPSLYYLHSKDLKSELFSHPDYLQIYEMIKQIIENGEKPSNITIAQKTNKDFDEITELLLQTNYDTEFKVYLDALKESVLRLKVSELISRIHEKTFHWDSSEAEKMFVEGLLLFSDNETEKQTDIKTRIKQLIAKIEQQKANNNIIGFPTGFHALDDFSGGFQETELIVLAGARSMGKTTLALTMVRNMAMKNIRCAIFSMEMSHYQITSRLLAAQTNISTKEYLRAKIDFGRMNLSMGNLAEKKIFIDDCHNSSIEKLLTEMRFYVARHGVKVFVVDYIQLVTDHIKGGSRELEVGGIIRKLKNFAKENDVCIIAISQLNRGAEKRPDGKPQLSDLRDSGQIEEAADTVIFVYRPEYYHIESIQINQSDHDSKGIAQLLLEKGRNIGTGIFNIKFIADIPTFCNFYND